ncbi:membrane hypothetical protein [Candidatus Sulfopaludibacter sp. SbA3]|nr:membrane hypothetical protein [Candidatus Sulfopaludibacter sp. SbA3]
MLAHLAGVSERSVLLALLAAFVLWMLRRRRTAALQHAVWALVVCGMLGLFAFGKALPRLPLRVLERPVGAVTPVVESPIVDQASPAPVVARSQVRRPVDWNSLAVYAYGAIAFAFLAQYAAGMFFVRTLLRRSLTIAIGNVHESERVAVPVTVGWLRPRVVLPLDWRGWNREKLDAVLAHEGAHVRRRDGLVAALAGVNRCLFWFHPLAWIVERKLALLAEQACDECCVAVLGDRDRYANLLLEMAMVAEHGRLQRRALTMAARSHMRQRIDSLLQEGRTFSQGLTRAGWAAVLLCGIPLVWGAGAVELDPLAAQVQTPAAVAPKFDVASVKPCPPGDGGGRGSNGGGASPGRLSENCMTVAQLIRSAYVEFADGRQNFLPLFVPIEGGPAWIHSDRYTIEATTEGTPGFATMRGPMLQALLEERFRLKIHSASREVPVYALTVAKGGPKLQPTSPGSCVPLDYSLPAPYPQFCGTPKRGEPGLRLIGATMADLCKMLSVPEMMERPVIDKTGIAGTFDIQIPGPGELHRGVPDDPSSSAFELQSAIQKLGLKLESAKGPGKFFVIDRVERPSEN